MSAKEWAAVVGVTLFTLAVVVIVMVGGQAFLVDTGRQIISR